MMTLFSIKHRSSAFLLEHYKVLVMLLVVSGIFAACENSDNSGGNDRSVPIAKVGERMIDWPQLWQSYHLEPKWGRGLTKQEAFSNQLDYLIEQKLFALEAIAAGAENHPSLSGRLSFIKEKEAIKALYRKHVESAVEISEEEYESAYKYSKMKVQFQYIQTLDSVRALRYAEHLKNEPFENISLVLPGVDEKDVSPMLSYGDVAEELEDAVFNMELNDVRGPIRIEDKFMVVKLVDGHREMFLSKMELAEQKSKLKKVLFERKATAISNEFVASIMAGKSLHIQREPFFLLAKSFNQIIQDKQSNEPIAIHVNNKEIGETELAVSDILDEPLVLFSDGGISVREFLGMLMNMPTGLRPQVNMAPLLRTAIIKMVRDHYLLERALQEGLDRAPDVLQQVENESDALLARFWMKNIRKKINVSPQDVTAFKESGKYDALKARFPKTLTERVLKESILNYKFVNERIRLADSLRSVYSAAVDSSSLLAKMENPGQQIDENPAQIFYRENYR